MSATSDSGDETDGEKEDEKSTATHSSVQKGVDKEQPREASKASDASEADKSDTEEAAGGAPAGGAAPDGEAEATAARPAADDDAGASSAHGGDSDADIPAAANESSAHADEESEASHAYIPATADDSDADGDTPVDAPPKAEDNNREVHAEPREEESAALTEEEAALARVKAAEATTLSVVEEREGGSDVEEASHEDSDPRATDTQLETELKELNDGLFQARAPTLTIQSLTTPRHRDAGPTKATRTTPKATICHI